MDKKKKSPLVRTAQGAPLSAARNKYRQATYLCSVHRPAQLPTDRGSEVAFAGRSNAGKSSVINVLTDHRGLARTSKQPGRTQQLNFFAAGRDTRLVDLPGYGYARAPGTLRAHWGQLINTYLEQRQCLVGITLITDIRRGLTRYDEQLLDWCAVKTMALHILLNKADKLGRNAAAQARLKVNRRVGKAATVQLFSATTKLGLEELLETLYAWTGRQTQA